MTPLRFGPLVGKQVARHRVRTLLTVSGIAVAMFLFSAVQAMQRGVTDATRVTAGETTLVVYRKDRFCPATSVLPQDYQARIEQIDGVVSALPVKVVVSNCRTSLDVVTFRGVPKDEFLAQRGGAIRIVSGSLDDWKRRTDAALIGDGTLTIDASPVPTAVTLESLVERDRILVPTDAVIEVLTGPNDGFRSDTRFVFLVIKDPNDGNLYQILEQREIEKL